MEFWRNLPSCADFAISESQFQSFILNPSRHLFRDGFFTSSFCPEFYTQLRYDRVWTTGWRKWGMPNGHHIEIRPLKWVLIRTIPELAAELRDDQRVLFLGRARTVNTTHCNGSHAKAPIGRIVQTLSADCFLRAGNYL